MLLIHKLIELIDGAGQGIAILQLLHLAVRDHSFTAQNAKREDQKCLLCISLSLSM